VLDKSIGIDIGGTKTAIGLFENGSLLKKKVLNTDAQLGGKHILNSVIKEIVLLSKEEKIKGIGIGAAGQISPTGEVLSATDTFKEWKGVNIKQAVFEATSYRIEVVNDVQAMGLGELHFGAGRNVRDFICIALGTGVGGAIIADGKLIRGHSGAAGEFGHMKLYSNGRTCPCGGRGCFESYVSGTALEWRYLEKYGVVKTGKSIFDKALEKDEHALDIVHQYLDDLIEGLSTLVYIFNPEKVIIGGGVANSLTAYLKNINDLVRKRVSDVNENVSIELSSLKGDAMLFGAASLVM
jgi:glucokinase